MKASAALTESPKDQIWRLLLALAQRAAEGTPLVERCDVALDERGELVASSSGGWLELEPASLPQYRPHSSLDEDARQLLDLYLPLCVGNGARSWVLGHIGQSLDGQIATATGASRNVTGDENIRHLHRLRALCDAVIVGAHTVERDDPLLTTRLAPGPNPRRVVIDPTLRCAEDRKLYRDATTPALVLAAEPYAGARELGFAEVAVLPTNDRLLSPSSIIDYLRSRGLRRLFVEGGGITVSRFLEARAFDRLHVTLCPIFIGRGSPGIVLSGIDRLDQALRPDVRRFALGHDVLFDCNFQS